MDGNQTPSPPRLPAPRARNRRRFPRDGGLSHPAGPFRCAPFSRRTLAVGITHAQRLDVEPERHPLHVESVFARTGMFLRVDDGRRQITYRARPLMNRGSPQSIACRRCAENHHAFAAILMPNERFVRRFAKARDLFGVGDGTAVRRRRWHLRFGPPRAGLVGATPRNTASYSFSRSSSCLDVTARFGIGEPNSIPCR